MSNGGGLLGALLGIAILATVAGAFFGKGASKVWNGLKETPYKIPKPKQSFW